MCPCFNGYRRPSTLCHLQSALSTQKSRTSPLLCIRFPLQPTSLSILQHSHGLKDHQPFDDLHNLCDLWEIWSVSKQSFMVFSTSQKSPTMSETTYIIYTFNGGQCEKRMTFQHCHDEYRAVRQCRYTLYQLPDAFDASQFVLGEFDS